MRYYQNVNRPLEEYIAPVDLQTIGNAYNTLEQGHLKALELRNQLEVAVANLDMDSSEDAFKAQLVSDIGKAIDDNAVNGNMYYSIGEIIKQQGNIAKNPAITGRLQANAARKQFMQQVDAMDVDDDIKAMAKELSPYYYEDKTDKNGNIIGGTTWAPGYTPVKQIDIASKVGDWIKLASPDKYGGTSVTFMDINGNVSSNYTPGSEAYVFSETTGKTEKLSADKLMAAINFGLQNTPGAMASIQQDMRVGLWKASKVPVDSAESLQYAIGISNGALDNNGQIKSVQQYLMDRISPAIYAKQYSNTIYTTKYHNDAVKAMKEAREQREAAANIGNYEFAIASGYSDIPYQNGPKFIAEDDSASEAASAITYLNGTIANRLRDIGVPESELQGVLFNDTNKIERLVRQYNPSQADRIMAGINKNIAENGANIKYYNQLHNGNYTDKELEALDYKAAIDGMYDPNSTDYDKSNRYVRRYNDLINSIWGENESIVYANKSARIDQIIKNYGGEDKLTDAGFRVINLNDGKRGIVIPKIVASRIGELESAIGEATSNIFRSKGNLGTVDEKGNFTKLSPRQRTGTSNMPATPFGQASPQIAPTIHYIANKFDGIYKDATINNKTTANIQYEVPSQVSPVSSPYKYYLNQLVLNSTDSKTQTIAKNKIGVLDDLLETELNNIDFENTNFSFRDENGKIIKPSAKQKKEWQAKLAEQKRNGVKWTAEDASIITNDWDGTSHTYVTFNTDDGPIRIILDQGRYSQEFDKLNGSLSRQTAAELYRSSYNNKPIQVGFDNDSNYFIEYAGKYGINGKDNLYNFVVNNETVKQGLTADEAQKYLEAYYQLRQQSFLVANARDEDKADYAKVVIPQLIERFSPIYGEENANRIVHSVIGL